MPASAANIPTAGLPLTPLQQGMYFTWLQNPAAGIDLEQMVCTLPEAVDASRLRAAWKIITARHEILRTTFTAEAATIHETLAVPWQDLDWATGLGGNHEIPGSPSSYETALQHFLENDRTTPLALTTGPLQRLSLIRLAPADYRLVWTFHHILLDGRAITSLLQQVFAFYDSSDSPSTPKHLPSFQSHNRWQAALDHTPSTLFWKNHLSGITGPTPLIVDHLAATPASSARPPARAAADHLLPVPLTSALRGLAASHGVTLNNFVQAAFALLLAR